MYAYTNITTEDSNCLQCVLVNENAPLCENVIKLGQDEIATLVQNDLLHITKLLTASNESPSVCSYTAGTFHGIYGRSNTTSIRFGDGFLANRLG